ncbi:MAG: hypothetical protein GWO16_15355, partial [Gammaproteobacteria bacterium]|nr:hypothetical protein [Gammaproteobacteria bacterium]
MNADGKRRLLALAAVAGLLLGLGPLAVHADDDEEDDGEELVRLEVQVMSEGDE